MFERFTEEARKAIFFARYEASTYGAEEIDTEHLLLGLLRGNPNLTNRLLPFGLTERGVRTRIETDRPRKESVSTSVDIPVNQAVKRVMVFGAEEAERAKDTNTRPEHLLLGIARQGSSLAATILLESGLGLAKLREVVDAIPPPSSAGIFTQTAHRETSLTTDGFFRDLTNAAERGDLTPLIGREGELGRVIGILSRRRNNNVALIGEPGVGKTAIVEALAQLIADGILPGYLHDRVLLADAVALFPARQNRSSWQRFGELLNRLAAQGNALLCIEGLFDLAASRSDKSIVEAMHILESHLSRGTIRCVATGTPAGLRRTGAKAAVLARHFGIVRVSAPDPAQAVEILNGLKKKYEQFHGVSFGEGSIETAVYASGRFLAHRSLPDRALDLLDEAGARVRLRRETVPPEVTEARRRIRRYVRGARSAIARQNLAAARLHQEAADAEAVSLRSLLERHASEQPDNTVTPDDVEQVIADRTGVSISAVKTALAQRGRGELEQTLEQLAAGISIAENAWVALLAAHIVRSSDQEIEALVAAIRSSRSTRVP